MLLIIVILFIAVNVSSASPLDGNRTITVMSRNLYIGTDLGPIINAQNQNTLFESIMTRFAEVQATNFSARAQALADEIALKKPDLIGLQEVILIRIQGPAATIEFDFLQILLDELAKRGQNYDIVVISNGFNIEAPVILPDGSCCQNFQITDREVILARKDLETSDIKLSNVQEKNFTNNLIVPIFGHQFPYYMAGHLWMWKCRASRSALLQHTLNTLLRLFKSLKRMNSCRTRPIRLFLSY